MHLILDLEIDERKKYSDMIEALLLSVWSKGVPISYNSQNLGVVKLKDYTWKKQGRDIGEIKMEGKIVRD